MPFICRILNEEPEKLAPSGGPLVLIDISGSVLQTCAMDDLINAIVANDVNIVKELLEQGANPNLALDAAGVSPLHFAAQNNALKVAELLILAGANLKCKTEEGETALDIARLHKHKDMVRLLEFYQLNSQYYSET